MRGGDGAAEARIRRRVQRWRRGVPGLCYIGFNGPAGRL
jgi:hypothetical protein